MGDNFEDEEELFAATGLVAFAVLLLTLYLNYAFLTYSWLQKISSFVPIASANMFLGVVLGSVFHASTILDDIFSFQKDFFFLVLLPPCIFAAGLELRKEYFFHNIGTIMCLAFIGTIISSFAIGGGLYAISSGVDSIPTMSFVDSMILGSLISAVDPIATIVVLEQLGVENTLYILIFGEAVLNDAAAIVINRTFVALSRENKGDNQIAPAAAMMIINAVLSVLVGCAFGWIITLFHKYSSLHKHLHLELGSFFLLVFIPYIFAECVGLSGVMAILFCGIVADYYTSGYLTPVAASSVHAMTKSIASLLESFIFVYLGMALFLIEEQANNWTFTFIVLGLCLVGRAVCVFPLSFIINRFRTNPLSFKYQLVMWFSGLRGPVAFALAFSAPHHTELILATTFT